jgi:hypothetical protein
MFLQRLPLKKLSHHPLQLHLIYIYIYIYISVCVYLQTCLAPCLFGGLDQQSRASYLPSPAAFDVALFRKITATLATTATATATTPDMLVGLYLGVAVFVSEFAADGSNANSNSNVALYKKACDGLSASGGMFDNGNWLLERESILRPLAAAAATIAGAGAGAGAGGAAAVAAAVAAAAATEQDEYVKQEATAEDMQVFGRHADTASQLFVLHVRLWDQFQYAKGDVIRGLHHMPSMRDAVLAMVGQQGERHADLGRCLDHLVPKGVVDVVGSCASKVPPHMRGRFMSQLHVYLCLLANSNSNSTGNSNGNGNRKKVTTHEQLVEVLGEKENIWLWEALQEAWYEPIVSSEAEAGGGAGGGGGACYKGKNPEPRREG